MRNRYRLIRVCWSALRVVQDLI